GGGGRRLGVRARHPALCKAGGGDLTAGQAGRRAAGDRAAGHAARRYRPSSAVSTRRRKTTKCDNEKLTTKLAAMAHTLPAASWAGRSASASGAKWSAQTTSAVVLATSPTMPEARNVT